MSEGSTDIGPPHLGYAMGTHDEICNANEYKIPQLSLPMSESFDRYGEANERSPTIVSLS